MPHQIVTREFTIGDLLRVPQASLKNSDGTPVNLTGQIVKFRMTAQSDGSVKVNDANATIVDPTTGAVKYQWIAADVNTAASYWAWFIRLEASNTEHFPAGHKFEIIIHPRT